MKKTLVALALAVLMLFSVVAMTACGEGPKFPDKSEIGAYLDISSVKYSGYAIEYEQKAEPTMEEVEKQLEDARVANKKALEKKEGDPEVALDEHDELVMFYIVYDENGDVVTSFGNMASAYDFSKMAVKTDVNFKLDAQTDDVLKLLAKELVGKMASESSFKVKEKDVVVTAEDYVYVSYHTETKMSTGDVTEGKETTAGINLADESNLDTVGKLLLAAVKGEVEGVESVKTGDAVTVKDNVSGTEDDVTYVISVPSAADGVALTLNVTVPEEYTKEALRGQTLSVKAYVYSANQFTLPEVNADFLKNTLKFETEKTEDEEVVAAYKDEQLKALKKADDAAKMQALWAKIVNASKMKAYPEDYINATKEELRNNAGANYLYLKQLSAAYGIAFTTAANAEEYIRTYFGAKDDADLDAILTTRARWIFQELAVYACISDVAGLELPEDEYDKAMNAMLEKYNKSQKEQAAEGTEVKDLTMEEYMEVVGGAEKARTELEKSFGWDYMLRKLMEDETYGNTFTVKESE